MYSVSDPPFFFADPDPTKIQKRIRIRIQALLMHSKKNVRHLSLGRFLIWALYVVYLLVLIANVINIQHAQKGCAGYPVRRISGAGFWHFQISGPDPDPANRLPDIRPDIRIRQTAGYPAKYPYSTRYLIKYQFPMFRSTRTIQIFDYFNESLNIEEVN